MDPNNLEVQPLNQPSNIEMTPPPGRPSAWRGFLVVGVVLLLLAGITYAAIKFLPGLANPKATPTPTASPQPGLSTTERTQVKDAVVGASLLQVTELTADRAELGVVTANSIQVNGDLSVKGNGTFGGNVTAANFQGNGAGLTGVDAALLGGRPASFYQNLANLGGPLLDSQLPADVARVGTSNAFTAANSFAGLLTASGTVTVTGPATFSGGASINTLALGTALDVGSGGTGLTSAAAGGVLYGTGGGTLGVATPAGAGLCLMSGVGSPTWGVCGGGGAGVASVNAQTGVLTIANATGAGGTITIDDASTAQKGLAQFNAGNFSAAGGVINTIQNIGTGATPTFAGVNANSLTPSAALTVGAVAQALTMQGSTVAITANNGANVTTLNFQAPTANVTYRLLTTTAGSYDICTTAGNCVGTGGGVTTPGGTNTHIAKFTGVQTLGDSLLTDNGALVTVGGNFSVTGTASITGALTLTTALTVPNGGTGATSLANNGVVIGQGTNPLTTATTVTPGQCLVSTAGAPAFASCPGSGGVASVDALTGALTINNTSGAGSTVTINDATTAAKGIASFNATNFTAAAGAINTVQNINTGATPTFAGVNTNAITPSASLTIGATAQSFVLQGNASATITSRANSHTTTVGFTGGSPTTDPIYQFDSSAATATYTICTTAGNCVGTGGGVTTPGGTNGTIPKFTGAQTLGNSIITDNGSTVTIGGTLAVNTITPTSAFTVGATAQNLTLQGAAVSLTATNAGTTNSLTFATPSGANKTVTIPNATGTVAVSASGVIALDAAGNITCPTCAVAGSGVTSLNGLTGALSVANATGSGSTVTINDASTAQKGIAQFNATNFSGTGTINTIQDIATTSSPTFVAVTAPTLNANTITPSGALTVGATAQQFTLQGNGASTLTSRANGHTTTVGFTGGSPTTDPIYQFDSSAATNTYTICTTAGNCVGAGGGVTTAGGTANKIAKFTAGSTIANSTITDTGTSVTLTPTSDGTAVFQVQNAATRAALTLGTSSGAVLTLGNITSTAAQGVAGSLKLADGTNDNFGVTLSAATLTANRSITIPNAGGTIAVSASGPLSLDAAGNLTCSTCVTSGGGGGGAAAVDSLDGLTGALTLANSTGAGSTVTINDATTAAKGIASFNSTNFTVSSGAVNTIQNIATTSAPSFGQLTITSSQAANAMLVVNNTNTGATGNLVDLQLNGSSKFSVAPNGNATIVGTVNGQTISSSANFTGSVNVATTLGVNTITPSAALTIGATGQSFTLQGSGSSTITGRANGHTTTVGFTGGSPTTDPIYQFDSSAATNTYTICTTAGNCTGVGGGVTTPGGTANRIAKFSAGSTIANSSLVDNGTSVTLDSNVNLVLQGSTATISNSQGQTATEVFGSGASATNDHAVVVGNGAASVVSNSVIIGAGAKGNAGNGGIAIGSGAQVNSTNGVAIGVGTTADFQATAVGGASSAVQDATAIGDGVTVGAQKSIAIGNTATVNQVGSIALGYGATTTAGGQLVVGSSSAPIGNIYVGNGINNAAPAGFTLQGTSATGADVAGAGVTLAGGQGTGTGAGGNVIIQAAAAGVSGSSANPLSTVATFAPANVTLGTNVDLFLQGATAYISNPQSQAGSEAFGAGATVSGSTALAVGAGATANGGVAIGNSATVSGFGGSTVVGNSASASDWSTVVGANAKSTGQWAVAIGDTAKAAQETVAVGTGAGADHYSVVLGYGAKSNGNDRIVLGHNAAATADGQFVAGSNDTPIDQVVFGNGVTNTAPVGFILQGTSGSGADVAGASTTIAAGQGTGSANGGDILFQTSVAGASGSTLRGLTTVGRFNGTNGSFRLQNAADSTAAFQVQTAGATNVLTADTSGNLVQIGAGGAGATNPGYLALGVKSTTGDPAGGVEGEMYYNTFDNKFRCFQGAAWTDCITAGGAGSFIQNQAASAQAASFFIQAANNGDITGVLREKSGQTADIFQVQAVAGTPIFQVAAASNLSTFTDNLLIKGQDASPAALVVQSNSAANNTNLIADFQRQDGTSVARIANDGGVYLGLASSVAGSVHLATGTNSAFGAIDASGLTAQHVVHLPNEDGTICVQNSTNCGFAPTTGSTAYIQNGTAVQTSANFNIRSSLSTNVTATIQGTTGQNADMLDLQTYNGTSSTTVANFNNVGALTLSGSGTTNFVTPVASVSLPSKISIPAYDPGDFGADITVGVSSGAFSTARGIAVIDARTTPHQPSIAVLSPDEQGVFGLGWNGSNTTAAVRTGDTNSGGVNTAGLSFFTGNAAGSSSNSGSISIDTGTATSATGSINIGTTNASSLSLGHSTAPVTVTGSSIGLTGNTTVTGSGSSSTALAVNATAASNIGLKIQGASSQTADLLQLKDSTGSNILHVDSAANEETLGYFNNGVGGIGTFQNLLINSEQIDNTSSPTSPWVYTNAVPHGDDPAANPAPDGQTTGDLVGTNGPPGGFVAQTTTTAPTNNNYTFSFWAKYSGGGTQNLEARIDGATTGTGTSKVFTATSTWQRFWVTQNTNPASGFSGNIKVTIWPGAIGGTGSIGVWGAQLVKDSIPEVYTRTTASPIAAGAGVVSNGGLWANALNASDVPLVVMGAPSQTGDLFQLQNSSGSALFKVSSAGALTTTGITSTGTISQTGDLTFATGATRNINFNASGTTNGSTLAITGNAGGAGNGGAVTITAGGASSGSTGGTVTIKGGNTSGAAVNGGVTIDTGTGAAINNGSVLIGNTNAATVTIGNTTPATVVNIQGGNSGSSGGINIGTANGFIQTVNIGNNSNSSTGVSIEAGDTNSIQIGNASNTNHSVFIATNSDGVRTQSVIVGNNTNVASTTAIRGGNGATAITLIPAASGSILIGASAGTGQITLGSSSQAQTVAIADGFGTATVNIANNSTGSNSISIGNATIGATNTEAIAIGTNATGTGKVNITLGSTNDGSTTTIQGGTGNINLVTNQAAAGTIIKTATNNSTTAFQIQNASSTQIFNVDTTANALNLVTNGSFEQNTTGWANLGTINPGISRDTTQHQYGLASLAIDATTSGGANDGAKYPLTLTATHQYNISFYAKLNTGSMTNFSFGYAYNGSDETTYASTGNTVNNSGWTRFTFTFTPASISGSPYLFFKQATGVSRKWWIDGIEIEDASNTNFNPYQESRLQVNGLINSPLVVQSANNTTGAFQVYSSLAMPELSVDTLNDRVGIGVANPTARLHVSGASANGLVRFNQTAAGDILDLVDNGTNVLTVSNTGATLFQNQTNSSTAFQIQNAGGSPTTLFNVDTTNGQITVAGSNDGTEFLVKANSTQSGSNPLIMLQNSNGTERARITASNNGDLFMGFSAGTSLSGGTGGNVGIGATALQGVTTGGGNVAIGNTALAAVSSNGGNVGVGSGAASNLTGGNNTAVGSNALGSLGASDYNTALGSNAGNVTGAGANFYYNGFLGYSAGNSDNDSFATTSNLHNSVAIGAFSQVQANNTIVLGNVDNTPAQVVIGSTMPTSTNSFGVSAVAYKTGTASQSGSIVTGAGGATWNAANGVKVGMRLIFANGTDGGTITAINSTTSLTVTSSQTVSSQNYRIENTGFQVTNTGDTYIQDTSASAFKVQDASGNTVFGVNTAASAATFKSATTNNQNALQVQNAAGNNLINISTITNTNLLANGSFENGNALTTVPGGWAKLQGAESTFQTDNTTGQFGTTSLKVITAAATANQGAKVTYPFDSNTAYTISFYVKGSGAFSTLDVGTNQNGVTITCSTGNSVTTGFTRITCPFTTGGATTTTDYVFIRDSSTTSHTFWIDGVQLERASSASNYVDPGAVNLIPYSVGDFEGFSPNVPSGSSGAAAQLTAAGFQLRGGTDGYQVGTVTSFAVTAHTGRNYLHFRPNLNGDGLQYNLALSPNTTYSLSLWLRENAHVADTFDIGRADNGSDTACLSGLVLTTTWTNYTCTFTTGATIGATPNLYIKEAGGNSADPLYLDGLTLYQGGTAVASAAPASVLQVDPLYNQISINAGNNAELQPWQQAVSTNLGARSRPGVASANGYLYMLGGGTATDGGSPSTNTYYARLNTDGTVGAWIAGTALSGTACGASGCSGAGTVIVNGYIYYISGGTGGSAGSSGVVQYAKLGADGSIGTWGTTTAFSVATAKADAGVAAYNGYIYVVAGFNTGSPTNSVYYGKVNPDGTISAWNPTAPLVSAATGGNAVVAANGYLYSFGGSASSTIVNYTKINPTDGSLVGWANSPANAVALNVGIEDGIAAVMNNNIYLIGGWTGTAVTNNVAYAPLNDDGSLGDWIESANPLPNVRENIKGAVANGYLYAVSGEDATTRQPTVFYTSGARLKLGGTLDLLGNAGVGHGAADGGSGGQLIAGNTNIIGTLQVQNAVTFNSDATIKGNFNVDSIFFADAGNERVTVGPPGGDNTGAILVLGTKNTTGDPATTIAGAIYYNAAMGRMRCFFGGKWRFCNDPAGLTWGYDFRDDFISATGTGIGEMRWSEDKVGTAAGVVSTAPDSASRLGQISLDPGTDPAGHDSIYINSFGGQEPIIIGGGEEIDMGINITALATINDDYVARFGLCDVTGGADCIDGVYFEYNRATSTNWIIATSNNSVRTKTTSGTAVATGWLHLQMIANAAGTQIDFYINGVDIGNITTNIPTTTARATQPAMIMARTATTADRQIKIDYFEMRNTFTTQR